MRETLKRLFKMMIGYGAIQWAGPALSFIFTPIITRVLSKSDYGVADYLLTIASALGTFALFGIPQAVTVHFNDEPDNEQWQRTIVGSALTLSAILGVGFGLILIALAPLFTAYTTQMQPYSWLIQLIGTSFLFGAMGSVLTTAAQAAMRVRWGMIFSIISIVGTLAGNLLFIVGLRLGVVGMILTPTVTGVCISLVALMLARGLIGKPSPTIMRLLLRSGGIVLPTLVAAWALQLIDRFFLVQYVSAAELGDYAVANKLATLVYVAMAPVYSSWTPLALALQHQPGALERYVSMSRYLIAIVMVIGLGVGLFATEILLVLTRQEYLPAAPYVGFLAYMHVFSGFGIVLSTGAFMSKQLKQMSGSIVMGAIINILLNYLLIPRYGVWGATIATFIGYGAPLVFLYIWLQRRDPIPYPIGRLLAGLAVQFGLLVISQYIPTTSFPIQLSIKAILLLLLPFSYVVLGIITPFELRSLGLTVRRQVQLHLGVAGAI